MADGTDPTTPPPTEAAAPGQQVRVHFDEREMSTSYANAYRTNMTADEVFLDFGVNMVLPNPQRGEAGAEGDAPAGRMSLKFNDRVILNYKTAKRLAMTLNQVVRAHEQQYGEIKLDARREG